MRLAYPRAHAPYPSLIRTLHAYTPTRLRALPIFNSRLTRLGRLTHLRAYSPLPSSIGPLRAFVLSCNKHRCVFRPPCKKFNIVRNDHGHTQTCYFSISDQKRPFWPNSAQKIKIVSLIWNLVPTPIHICRIQWWCSLFLFSTINIPFWANMAQNCQFELKFDTYANLNM